MGGTIVCGVTGSVDGRCATELAAALAARLRLRLVLVHVVAGGPADAAEELLARAAADTGEAAEARVVAGPRAEALAQVAAEEGADLIVVGSQPAGVLGRRLQCSLARELEAATPVPVLIAPPSTRKRSVDRLALAAGTR